MRLKEEKNMILLGIISALIILVVFFIQIADNKISEHKKNFIIQQNNLNLQQGKSIHALLNNYWNRNFGFFISHFTPKVIIDPISSMSMNLTKFMNADKNNQVRDVLWEQVKENKLNLEDYYFKMSDIYYTEYKKSYNKYHTDLQKFYNENSIGTVWEFRKSILVVMEFILIFIYLFGYALLFKMIKGRRKIETHNTKTNLIKQNL